MRNILFASKMWNVEVQDNLGNVLVCYTNVPGNTKDEAQRLVAGKLIYATTQQASPSDYTRPTFHNSHPNDGAEDLPNTPA